MIHFPLQQEGPLVHSYSIMCTAILNSGSLVHSSSLCVCLLTKTQTYGVFQMSCFWQNPKKGAGLMALRKSSTVF